MSDEELTEVVATDYWGCSEEARHRGRVVGDRGNGLAKAIYPGNWVLSSAGREERVRGRRGWGNGADRIIRTVFFSLRSGSRMDIECCKCLALL